MWVLPRLVSGGGVCRLPLCDHTAARLAIGLWEPEDASFVRRLVSLLKTDPSLAVWVACRNSAPKGRSSSWNELATLLAREIDGVFVRLESAEAVFSDFDFRRRQWAELAIADVARWKNAAGDFAPILNGASDWLRSASQDSDVPALLPPNWRFSITETSGDMGPENLRPEDIGVPGEDVVRRWWLEPNEHDLELSRMLPAILDGRRKLRQLEAEFADKLELEKLESLRQFAYGAGHEINNPLANIATRGQALLRDEPDSERRRKLTTIVSQAFRAHEMITDLMLFARPPAPIFTSFDSAELLREILAECMSDARLRGTSTNLQAPSGIMMTADRTQIAMAVKALLRNALEALGRGGHVEVLLRVDQDLRDSATTITASPNMATNGAHDHVEITVRDSGPGIPVEVRRHMFDPFYSGRESGRGLGFGLSKCWRIVDLHAGKILVDSQPGVGTTITLRIPQRGTT